MGFCVAEIEGNEDCPFGNDHRFFEKRGFIHVSEMYKLT